MAKTFKTFLREQAHQYVYVCINANCRFYRQPQFTELSAEEYYRITGRENKCGGCNNLLLPDADGTRKPVAPPKAVKPSKVRLTPEQKKALADYEYALKQEDRYLGSVFVTAAGQRAIEAKTKAAYDRCKRLGMTHEHGL